MRKFRSFRIVIIAALAGGSATFGATTNGHAQAATASAGDARGAGQAFTEGQRAYKHGDFRHAAESFERAYSLLPKLPALWNAARAWQEGGEATRAANLYAKYLSLAPPSAPDRDHAIKSLNQLNEKLSRVEIHASDFKDVQLDGAAVEGIDDAPDHTLVVYVNPGAHVVDGAKNGEHSLQKQTVAAGAIVSVVLTIEPTEKKDSPPPPIVVETHTKGLPPWVLLIGGGLTVVSLGVTIWSGLDTQSQKSTFTQTPTQQNLDDGRSKETRTNVLIGVTAGFAVITGVTAIFVDWKSLSSSKEKPPPPQQVRLGVGPGSMMIEGRF
jgi:hypothetical protein